MNEIKPIAAIPSASRLAARMQMSSTNIGNRIEDTLLGRSIVWEVVRVPADKVELATMVWSGNERCQALLDARSLADVLAQLDQDKGNDELAKGRRVNGIIEVANGSRRRASCIIANAPYNILVCDDLTNDEMDYLSDIGNRYNAPGAWEKGHTYKRLADQFGSLREVEKHLQGKGEKISRRTIERSIRAAEGIPVQVMGWFNNPARMTAAEGADIADNITAIIGGGMAKEELLAQLEHDWLETDGGDDSDETLITFLKEWRPLLTTQAQPKARAKALPVIKEWRAGKLTRVGNKFNLVLKKSLSEDDQNLLAIKLEQWMADLELPPQLRGSGFSPEMYQEYSDKLDTVARDLGLDRAAIEGKLLDLAVSEDRLAMLLNIRHMREECRKFAQEQGQAAGDAANQMPLDIEVPKSLHGRLEGEAYLAFLQRVGTVAIEMNIGVDVLEAKLIEHFNELYEQGSMGQQNAMVMMLNVREMRSATRKLFNIPH
ncbi:MAG: hypothetical protein ACRC1N_01125 [Aeromonas sobria]